jgi:hypothetical protein
MSERQQPDKQVSLEERIPTLENNGFFKISNVLPEERERVIQEIYRKHSDRDLSVIKGKIRENITDEKSKWKEATFVFDSHTIEAVMIPNGTDESEYKNHSYIRTYWSGFPILYTPHGTVLLRPIEDLELRSA